mgnify:CR=1 FL=1
MKKIALLIILLSTFLFSNFIGMNSGARSLSMGNAFVALSDESTAIFYNPAGLAKVNEFDLIASRENLYGVSDLYNDMIAISFPTSFFRTGLAAQQISLIDTYSEQIFYLSIAGIIRPKNIPIRFGGSVKYESVKVENYQGAKSPANLDLDFGLLIDITENIFLGYSVKNLLEPEFEFISSSDGLDKKHMIGLCYNWRSSVNFLADYIWTSTDSQWNLGSEIWFFDVFAARLGMYNEKLTAGFGLKTKNWSVDSAVLTHEQLGSTYRISLGLKVSGKK